MHDPNPHYASLFQATVREAAAGGALIMGRLAAALRRDLHARESASRDFRERDVHAESLKQLYRHEAALCEAYGPALLEQFTRPPESVKAVPTIAEVQFDQLELMDEVQVQESVNMARAQQMAMLAADASLAELNTLISTTLGLQTVRPERNPLRPEAYLSALRNTVERTPVPAGIRLDWLSFMGIALGAELRAVYGSMAAKLHAQGVVAASYAVTPAPSTSGIGGVGKVREAAVSTPYSEVVRYGAPGSPEREALIAREMKASRPVADPALLTLDRLRKLLAGELDQQGTSHRVAAFAQQFARQFETPGHSHGAAMTEGHTDFAATVPAAFEALTEMKQVDRVVQRLEQRRGGLAPQAGSQGLHMAREDIRRSASGVAQALSLEVVNLMVDNIARDPRLLEPVQNLVRELEPALMRLALVDARLFTDKHHAARLLVQEITSRSLAFANVQSPGFLAFLDEVREALAPLAAAPIEGPDLFLQALQDLQSVWQEESSKQAKAHSQAVKALERAEQRNLLAEKIAREIDSHPDAGKVPEVVLGFLCGPWAQVVAQARLAGGSGSAAADKYQALVSALLWSTHPELAPKNIAKLTKLVPLLLNTLRDGLETIQYPSTKTSVFLEALMGLHQAIFRSVQKEAVVPAVKVEVQQPVVYAAVVPRSRPVEDGNPWVAPAEAEESNFLDLPDEQPAATATTIMAPVASPVVAGTGAGGLPLGSWVELQAHGDWVRTQLTWASPHGTLFLFTSAAGSTQSMTRRTHDKLVAAGQLRVISAQTVVDGALDAVAQQAMKNSVDSTM